MDTATKLKPKTMAELMPEMRGMLSKDALQSLTAKKQPKSAAQTRTAEKTMKPLTIAQMLPFISALNIKSPRRLAKSATSTKKRNWNSSTKVDKTVSHTADGKLKNNPVRKVLNFQSKQSVFIPRSTINAESPKFYKPELKAKKTLLPNSRNNIRISGVSNIQETPLLSTRSVKHRTTISNKENYPHNSNKQKIFITPKPVNSKKLIPPLIPYTPLSNTSWKSSCDASFLQKEKEINDIEEMTKAITDEQTLEKIDEVSPPVSTPFKEYRNVKEFFNNSSDIDSSVMHNDNTIMFFDKPEDTGAKREESVIVSLCDLLNKASVTTNSHKNSNELDDLLQVEKETENNIKMIENGIQTLKNIKVSQLKSLQSVRELITKKNKNVYKDETLIEAKHTARTVKKEEISPEKSTVVAKPCSVIKSPSYKIPKKNQCLRKKVFCKSMPNIPNEMLTPKKDMGDKALNIYMKMKEHMNFLNTPVVKSRTTKVPDTPTVTSHNLQLQLDKLYCRS